MRVQVPTAKAYGQQVDHKVMPTQASTKADKSGFTATSHNCGALVETTRFPGCSCPRLGYLDITAVKERHVAAGSQRDVIIGADGSI
jgi:hypothetical protein